MDQFDIMFDDLIPETQKALLEFLGISSIEEGNYDVVPIAEVVKPDVE